MSQEIIKDLLQISSADRILIGEQTIMYICERFHVTRGEAIKMLQDYVNQLTAQDDKEI